jgi:hypothetical protein
MLRLAVPLLYKITLSGRSIRMEVLPPPGCVGVISLAALDEGLHPRTKITVVEFAPATGVKIRGLCAADGPGYILSDIDHAAPDPERG